MDEDRARKLLETGRPNPLRAPATVDVEKLTEQVKASAQSLDGSLMADVSLLSGLTPEQINDLGGV